MKAAWGPGPCPVSRHWLSSRLGPGLTSLTSGRASSAPAPASSWATRHKGGVACVHSPGRTPIQRGLQPAHNGPPADKASKFLN